MIYIYLPTSLLFLLPFLDCRVENLVHFLVDLSSSLLNGTIEFLLDGSLFGLDIVLSLEELFSFGFLGLLDFTSFLIGLLESVLVWDLDVVE